MFPQIAALVQASADCVRLLGPKPLRFFIFGEADDKPKRPYAVWQTAYGSPENKLAGVPDEDVHGIQIDVYADTAGATREIAQALRDALEPHSYVVSWNGESREPDTRLFRYSFTVEIMTAR